MLSLTGRFAETELPIVAGNPWVMQDVDSDELAATTLESLCAGAPPTILRELQGGWVVIWRTGDTHHVARDPFGQHGAYWSRDDEGVVHFGDDPLTVARASGRSFEVSAEGVFTYLRRGWRGPAHETMLAGVHAVPAASVLSVSAEGEVSLDPYWRVTRREPEGILDRSPHRTVGELMTRAVRSCASDATSVAIASSGGLDSVAVEGWARAVLAGPIESLRYREPGASRSPNDVAVPHFSPESLRGFLAESPEPTGDGSAWVLRELLEVSSRRGCDRVLTGEGADEIFGGHLEQHAALLSSLLKRRRFPDLARMARRLWRQDDPPQTLARLGTELLPRPVVKWLRVKMERQPVPPWLDTLASSAFDRDSMLEPQRLHDDPFIAQLTQDLTASATPHLLRWSQTCARSAGVDLRHPFLTTHLVDAVWSLPLDQWAPHAEMRKSLLRQAARDQIPSASYRRDAKSGFATPMSTWIEACWDDVRADLTQLRRREFPWVRFDALPLTRPPRAGRDVRRVWRTWCLALWLELTGASW